MKIKLKIKSTAFDSNINSYLYIELDDLWQALYISFNSAYNWQVNIDILDKIQNKLAPEWNLFSKEEFKIAISKYNNLLASGLDKILWRLLKQIINVESCLTFIININNTYINLEY